ncbi:MAG: hypothetical protein IKH30_00475 [Clostridia bacterium]|nr:hypothetical protein [Clostridia bacterium]
MLSGERLFSMMHADSLRISCPLSANGKFGNGIAVYLHAKRSDLLTVKSQKVRIAELSVLW